MAGARAGSDGNSHWDAAFDQLRQITGAVDVPVTADLEGGYDMAPADFVDALLEAGAVGCNLEDTDYSTGDRLLDADARAAYLADVRAAAVRRRGPRSSNARIDAIIQHPDRDPAAAMDEVLRRARLYFDAGVDCVYPITLRDPALVAQIVKELGCPVDVNPAEPLAALAEAGAAHLLRWWGPPLGDGRAGAAHPARARRRRRSVQLRPASPPTQASVQPGGGVHFTDRSPELRACQRWRTARQVSWVRGVPVRAPVARSSSSAGTGFGSPKSGPS